MSSDNTLGAMHIGTSLGAFGLGITAVQTLYYYVHYSKDRLALKVLVAWISSLDLLHQICIEHNIYMYTVKNFANPSALVTIFWSLIAQVFVIGFQTLTVQSFYVWRLWRLSVSKAYYLPIFVLAAALAQFGLLMFYCKKIIELPSLLQADQVAYLQQSINALSCATDIIIALGMVWRLYESRTGFSKPDSILTRLTIMCLNSGALTSISAIWVIISIAVWLTTYIYMIFYFLLGRLYTNSLLATLNVRKAIGKTKTKSFSHQMSTIGTASREGSGLTFLSMARGTISTADTIGAEDVVAIERTASHDESAKDRHFDTEEDFIRYRKVEGDVPA